MEEEILICLDLLKHPYSGMGRVSADFAKEISTQNNFNLSFLVPQNNESKCNFNGREITLTNYRKVNSSYLKGYAICHVLHQLPKFSFKRAKKVVLTIHDLNFLHVKSKSKQLKYKNKVQKAINKADYICFISEFTKQECYQHMHISTDKSTKVIYNGVGNLAEPSARPYWCPDGDYLFSIGQFLFKKNFHVLLPFLNALPLDIKLVIAGQNETSYGNEIRSLLVKHKLSNRVILPGPISEEEKSYLYHHCKAFVFPSLAEGFGLPIIEAMKCRKPVFCSDKTSLKEIGNEYAFFWTNFDPNYMVHVFNNGLTEFNTNKKIEQQLEYANSFTWEKNAKEYLEVYQELLAK